NLGIEDNVDFLGFVSEEEKRTVLERSHILISPSAKEGWGLTIHEAGSRGTPAVGYNVEGLKEIILSGVNGFLCKENTPKDLADFCLKLLNSPKLYKKLQMGALS